MRTIVLTKVEVMNIISCVLLGLMLSTAGYAQEEEEVQNEDIIKTEIKLGHQFLSNHGQHLFGSASGESNLLYNKYGHIQILPFQVNIYSHYEGLSHVQIQNMKATAINFMMDQDHFGVGLGMVTKENFGYRETQVGVKTVAPVVLHAFHTVEFENGETVLKVSGYISYGKAYGFGENTRYAFDVEGTHFNGSVVPAGIQADLNINKKVQVKGFVDYQHLQSDVRTRSFSPVTRGTTTNSLILNEVKYGMTVNMNLSEILTEKLKGVNLYVTVSNQQMQYKQTEKSVTAIKGSDTQYEHAPVNMLSKQSYLNVQAGVSINLNMKKKAPTKPRW